MKKIRAIYTGDVRFDLCPVFELDFETNYFVMIKDNEFKYGNECVYEDRDFLIFEVENDEVKIVACR